MSRRLAPAAGACALAAAMMLSCREVPSPEGGVQALSPIILPSPGVVAGDTMRDSLGFVAPLRVIGYDASGDPVTPEPTPTFVSLDSVAHMAGAFLIGDKAGLTAHVIGSVASLQSQTALVKVTLSPDSLAFADSAVHRKTYSLLSGDTVAATDLAARVWHVAATPTNVEAVIVRFSIVSATTGNGSGPLFLLLNGNATSDRDTSDATGRASRTLRFRALATKGNVDTAIVRATAAYRGRSLGAILYTVVITKQ